MRNESEITAKDPANTNLAFIAELFSHDRAKKSVRPRHLARKQFAGSAVNQSGHWDLDCEETKNFGSAFAMNFIFGLIIQFQFTYFS